MSPRQSKALATSGVRWGLSCEVENEASMGVLLGYMKLFGASAIGFSPLEPTAAKRKNPARVAAGKKSGGRPKGTRSHSRGSLMDDARGFVSHLPAGHEFGTQDLHQALKRWSLSARSRALMLLTKEKAIKRVSPGLYRVTKHLALVKQEKAA
jgi:hypothetical protein